MINLEPVAAQSASTGTAALGVMDPLFILAVVGSLLFVWMLIRFIVDDLDLRGDVDDFTSSLAGMPRGERKREKASGEGFESPAVRPLHPAQDGDPHTPRRRGRPAA